MLSAAMPRRPMDHEFRLSDEELEADDCRIYRNESVTPQRGIEVQLPLLPQVYMAIALMFSAAPAFRQIILLRPP